MQILGVSFDTVAENAAFAEAERFGFPILCDTERELGLAYGAASDVKSPYAKRITYVISPDGKIEQVFASVSVKSHPAAVLESIPRAAAGR